jgi:hypothetical protein
MLAAGSGRLVDLDESIGVAHGQALEEGGMHQAEDGDVDAQPHRQGHHGGGRECGRLPEGANRMTQVL